MNKKYIFLIVILFLIFLPKPYNTHNAYSNGFPVMGGCFNSCTGINFNHWCFGFIIERTCQNPITNINYFGILDGIIN